jgi:hypothetical protein
MYWPPLAPLETPPSLLRMRSTTKQLRSNHGLPTLQKRKRLCCYGIMERYYNGEGHEIVQCCNALSYATITLLNEPRASDKSSDFVLFPSDPTQMALETTESHCAILFSAALMTAEVGGPKKSLPSRELENSQRRSQLLLTRDSRICSR